MNRIPAAGAEPNPLARRRDLSGLALGFCAVVLFGGSLPATRYVLPHLDPWFLTAARDAIPGLIAIILLVARRRPLPARADWPALLVVILGVVAGFPILSALAMQTVPASHGGVVLGIMPLATAVFAAIIAGERPSPAFWSLALLGAALVVTFAVSHGGGFALTWGDLYLFGAIVAATLGYVFAAKLATRLQGWEVISWAVAAALPVSLCATVLLWPSGTATVPAAAWLGVAYVGLFPQFIAFFFWNVALAIGGIARIGQLQLLQGFTTIGIATVLNGEPLDLEVLAFAAAVAIVVMLGRRTRVRR